MINEWAMQKTISRHNEYTGLTYLPAFLLALWLICFGSKQKLMRLFFHEKEPLIQAPCQFGQVFMPLC